MSNFPPRNSRIYLDTWFLLRVFIDDFDRVNKKKVKQVLAELLIRKCLLVTSPLSFVEMVKVVNDQKRYNKVGNKLIRKINNLFKSRIVIGLTGVKYSDMNLDIKLLLSAMERLSKSGSFQVLESQVR